MIPLTFPLTLHLPDTTLEGDSKVTCVRAVRVIANRRSVYQATWGGNDVFVKLFFDKVRASSIGNVKNMASWHSRPMAY